MALVPDRVLFGPIYTVMGDTATVTPEGGSPFDITAIDKSAGIIVGTGVDVGTLEPAVLIRCEDLANMDPPLEADDLVDADLTINGVAWKVRTTRPAPGMGGEISGELYLCLAKP